MIEYIVNNTWAMCIVCGICIATIIVINKDEKTNK